MFDGSSSSTTGNPSQERRKEERAATEPTEDPLEQALAELTAQAEEADPSPGTAELTSSEVSDHEAAPPASEGDAGEELERARAELAAALRERDAAMGDAEQIATESRQLQEKLALAQEELEKGKAELRNELETERERRSNLEQELARSRQELSSALEAAKPGTGEEEVDRLRSSWEGTQRELTEREAELATLRGEHDQERERRSQAEGELDRQRTEATRLAKELQDSSSRIAQVQGEVEEARAASERLRQETESGAADLARTREELESVRRQLEEEKGRAAAPDATSPALAPATPASAPTPTATAAPTSRVVPSVPVAFLAADGRSIAKQAFFAVGKGEALEAFLSTLLAQWRGSKLPLVPSVGPEGFSMQLKGDPFRRSLRILPSGAIQIQLSAPELKEVADLPPLVSRKRPSAPKATSAP